MKDGLKQDIWKNDSTRHWIKCPPKLYLTRIGCCTKEKEKMLRTRRETKSEWENLMNELQKTSTVQTILLITLWKETILGVWKETTLADDDGSAICLTSAFEELGLWWTEDNDWINDVVILSQTEFYPLD